MHNDEICSLMLDSDWCRKESVNMRVIGACGEGVNGRDWCNLATVVRIGARGKCHIFNEYSLDFDWFKNLLVIMALLGLIPPPTFADTTFAGHFHLNQAHHINYLSLICIFNPNYFTSF